MPLDSTGANAIALQGNIDNEQTNIVCSKENSCASINKDENWTYLFVRRDKVKLLCKRLEGIYPTFIHTNIIRKKGKNKERPTISGLVFIHGNAADVQSFLKKEFLYVYLAKDCSTGKYAVIQNDVMEVFIRTSRTNPSSIRFMPHSIEYYAQGNQSIRITSGLLAGLEGYRIRIARDRCLITSIGGMTISIGGIHKDSFENIEEYVKLRRSKREENLKGIACELTPLQKEIDKDFFEPKSELDILALENGLSLWLKKTYIEVESGNFSKAMDIANFVLEEMGNYLEEVYYNPKLKQRKSIKSTSQEFDKVLLELQALESVPNDVKSAIQTSRESLSIRFPFLSIDV